MGAGWRARVLHAPRLSRGRAAASHRRQTWALVNVDLGPSTVVGIVLICSGAALYQVRAVRPGASRDYDIFFSSVALLVGGILCFQGWRLDPILLFGQILTITAAIAFGVEAIQLRKENDSRSDRPPWVTNDRRDDRRGGGGRSSYELPSSRRPTVSEWEQQQQWEQAPPRPPAQWNEQAQRWEEEPLSSWEEAQWEDVEVDPYGESGAFQQAYEQGRRGNNSPSSSPPPEEARDAPYGRRSSTADTPAQPRPQPPSWQVDDWE